MSTHADLHEIVRLTMTAVHQQSEAGVESLYAPEGLETALKLPKSPEKNATPVHRPETLRELYARYCDCTRCRLGSRRQRFVFGAGNEQAVVMFIGEAPGAEEDAQGLPFVGEAGQLLARILQAIEFTRDEVYIANTVKCRPPNNRDPEPEEIASCLPILEEQIRLVRPALICALGRIAAHTLLRSDASLNNLRGRFHDYQGIKVLVTYHPSALLRNAAFKRPTWEDMKMLRREYDRLTAQQKAEE